MAPPRPLGRVDPAGPPFCDQRQHFATCVVSLHASGPPDSSPGVCSASLQQAGGSSSHVCKGTDRRQEPHLCVNWTSRGGHAECRDVRNHERVRLRGLPAGAAPFTPPLASAACGNAARAVHCLRRLPDQGSNGFAPQAPARVQCPLPTTRPLPSSARAPPPLRRQGVLCLVWRPAPGEQHVCSHVHGTYPGSSGGGGGSARGAAPALPACCARRASLRLPQPPTCSCPPASSTDPRLQAAALAALGAKTAKGKDDSGAEAAVPKQPSFVRLSMLHRPSQRSALLHSVSKKGCVAGWRCYRGPPTSPPPLYHEMRLSGRGPTRNAMRAPLLHSGSNLLRRREEGDSMAALGADCMMITPPCPLLFPCAVQAGGGRPRRRHAGPAQPGATAV